MRQPSVRWLPLVGLLPQWVLALFEEWDTRDESGLGGIRDSVAGHLFSGTGKIQTASIRHPSSRVWHTG